MDYKLNDLVTMKKNHTCGKNDTWKIIRMGADIKIKCQGCGHVVMMSRSEFENKLKTVVNINATKNSPFDITYKIHDRVKLGKKYDCIKCHTNSWKLISLGNKIEILCEYCQNKISISKSEFEDNLIVNLTKEKKAPTKKITQKERKEIEIEKQADYQKQISLFGRKLSNGDLLILKDKYTCPNCNKKIYTLSNLSKNPRIPAIIKCTSCSDIQKQYKNDLPINIQNTFEEKNVLSLEESLKNGYYTCPNCNRNTLRISTSPRYIFDLNLYINLNCSYCSTTKSLNIDRNELYDNIIEHNQSVILELRNKTFKSLEKENDRIEKKDKTYSNLKNAIRNDKLVLKLQLIDSNNNHVTLGHTISNRVIEIPYKRKSDDYIKVFSYKCHYCHECNTYFDFYNSFLLQIEKIGVGINDLSIVLQKSFANENTTVDNTVYQNFNSESFLHSWGYKVGYYGLGAKDRHNLLKTLIDNNIMSISEIKRTINSNIKTFSNRYEYDLAVSEWEDDLNFVNSLIK